MLKNLVNAISTKGITKVSISKALSVTEKTLANKINEESEFTVKEALTLKRNFFPEYDFEYLLRSDRAS